MSKLKVLVVDDAIFIRDLVKKGLRSHFHDMEIEDAPNGLRAQQLLAVGRFDLILCDWEMPEMSGLELLNWCRKDSLHNNAIPFIMVTSRSDKENVMQAIQAGVTDYIGKPFTNDQLITKVRKALIRIGKLEASPSDHVVAHPAPAAAPKAASTAPMGRGRGHLRLSAGNLSCVIKAISLKEALLIVRRGAALPQVTESAVLDLEQGESGIVQLNGYLHSVAAHDPSPDTEWLLLNFRFVDADPQKLDYLSRLITSHSIGNA